MTIRPPNRPDRHLGGARAKPAEIYEKSSGNSDWTFSECGQKLDKRNEEVLRYKTAQKKQLKVNKKASGHTYVQIRNQKTTNGTTVKQTKSSEVRIC